MWLGPPYEDWHERQKHGSDIFSKPQPLFLFLKERKTISGQSRQWKVYKKSTLLKENNNNLTYVSEVNKRFSKNIIFVYVLTKITILIEIYNEIEQIDILYRSIN